MGLRLFNIILAGTFEAIAAAIVKSAISASERKLLQRKITTIIAKVSTSFILGSSLWSTESPG